MERSERIGNDNLYNIIEDLKSRKYEVEEDEPHSYLDRARELTIFLDGLNFSEGKNGMVLDFSVFKYLELLEKGFVFKESEPVVKDETVDLSNLDEHLNTYFDKEVSFKYMPLILSNRFFEENIDKIHKSVEKGNTEKALEIAIAGLLPVFMALKNEPHNYEYLTYAADLIADISKPIALILYETALLNNENIIIRNDINIYDAIISCYNDIYDNRDIDNEEITTQLESYIYMYNSFKNKYLLMPETKEELIFFAQIALDIKRYDRFFIYIENLYKKSDFLSIYILLSNFINIEGKTEDLLNLSKKMIEIEPFETEYYIPLIEYYLDRRDFKRARKIYFMAKSNTKDIKKNIQEYNPEYIGSLERKYGFLFEC